MLYVLWTSLLMSPFMEGWDNNIINNNMVCASIH